MENHDAISQLTSQLANLATLIALAFGAVLANALLTALNAYLSRAAAKTIEAKVDDNTFKTVAGTKQLAQQVESAKLEVTEQATSNTKAAAEAAIQTATLARHTSVKTLQQNEKVTESLGKIEERLNGGPDGLASLVRRVSSLETQFTELFRGQVDIVKSIDHLSEVIQARPKA